MTFPFDQMIADRDAGTQGGWVIGRANYKDSGRAWINTSDISWHGLAAVVTTVEGERSAAGEANARRIARVPLLEAEIIRLTARVIDLEGALGHCVAAIEHADMSDGVCCCGENMEGHSNPMDCGHSPTDMGEHHAYQVLNLARAALSTTEEPKT